MISWFIFHSSSNTFSLSLSLICPYLNKNRGKCANVIVTPSPLVLAITKVLLHQLAEFFPIENIYSTAKVGHEIVFQKLTDKYGKNCTFVVIGDGHDEEAAARKFDMPFWRISCLSDLQNLYRAMEFQYVWMNHNCVHTTSWKNEEMIHTLSLYSLQVLFETSYFSSTRISLLQVTNQSIIMISM